MNFIRASLVAAAALALLAGDVRAQPAPPPPTDGDAVALLPLDAGDKLEIYGQPVASEIARALVAGSIDVVVVGPRMAVPERARLIVDGRIAGPPKGVKSDAVTLTIRVRNAKDGIVLETLEATAPTLANIDKAAAELSARVLPVVRGKLAAVSKPMPAVIDARRPLVSATPTVPRAWAKVVTRGEARLASAFSKPDPFEPHRILELDVRRFVIDRSAVPLARARVHAKITIQGRVVFDRTIVTDTVVGDRGMTDDALAKRTADEVLAILLPHQRRLLR